MPSLSMYQLPIPTDSLEFEKMLMDYARSVYHAPASLYGRKGQKQHGIDVIVDTNPRTFIQCKDYQRTSVTTSKIDSWIAEAENHPISFTHFVIAVTAPIDAKIQEYVYRVSDERAKEGKYTVSILFWADIEHVIKIDPNLLRIYYPEFYISEERVLESQKIKVEEKSAIKTAMDKPLEDSILINSEAKLRAKFLELVVKYHIQAFLRADAFEGFSFDLVTDVDCFTIDMQSLLDKSIMMGNWSLLLGVVKEFNLGVDKYNAFLSYHCQLDNTGSMVKIYSYDEDEAKLDKVIEQRRNAVLDLLKEIETWES